MNPQIYKNINKNVDNSRQILNLSDLNVKYHALDSKFYFLSIFKIIIKYFLF